MKSFNLRYYITGIILGILFFSFQPQQILAFSFFKPPKLPVIPKPTIIIPTIKPYKPPKWIIRPIKTPTPTITPSSTPTSTPTPTQPSGSGGPYFKLEIVDPSKPITVGNTFNVKILINTGGILSVNGDVLLSYDGTKITVNSAQSGNFFTYFSADNLGGTNSKYLVSSWENVIYAKQTSTDTLFATISLSAKEAGTTIISFDCTPGSENDSNINRASDFQDIINCNLLIPLNIKIE